MCLYPAGRALIEERLPDFPMAPTVVLYQDQLQRFHASYMTLLQFAADVTGVELNRLNMIEMEKWRREHGLPVRDALIRHWFEEAGLELPPDMTAVHIPGLATRGRGVHLWSWTPPPVTRPSRRPVLQTCRFEPPVSPAGGSRIPGRTATIVNRVCTADVVPAAVPLLAGILADMRDQLAADAGVDPDGVLIGPVDFGTAEVPA